MQLILLSGPSGGGKTTFLHLLQSGALQEPVRRAFPGDAGTWPIIDITNRLRSEIEKSGPAAVWQSLQAGQKAILHYDIVSVHRAGLSGYAADPAFRLLEGKGDVRVAFLKPEPGRLLSQFASRNEARLEEKIRDAGVIERRTQLLFDSLGQRLGLAKGSTELALYADAVELDRLYASWIAFASELARRHGGHPLVTLTPSTGPDGRPDFDIVPAGGV